MARPITAEAGKRAEVATVEAVADLPVHQEQLAGGDRRGSPATPGSGRPRRSRSSASPIGTRVDGDARARSGKRADLGRAATRFISGTPRGR